jgi:hypothetical protein
VTQNASFGLACAILAGPGLAAAAPAAEAGLPPHRFALVVAENEPHGGALMPLRYADDDGLRYAEFLRSTGAQVELLTVLDDETQRRAPGAAAGTRPPVRAEVQAAMARLNAGIERARSAGLTVDFYFVFAGHGEAGENGEGRMHLRDGTLSRADLMSLVVAPSKADFNHLVIDACHAQALVFNRGGADDDGYRPDDYSGAIARYLDAQDLRAYPNTGAILASTAGRETHEWEVFGAGIFSHEVRSGLAGVADVNGDGAVEYSELAAYVSAANDAIVDPAARPQVVFQPPARDRNRPLLAYTDGPTSFLRIPRGFTGRAWLEDARGNRYADFNGSGEAPIVLALADAPFYYLRRDTEEARVDPPRPGVIDETRLSWRRREVATRGALNETFERRLFARPFGPAYYAGFVSSAGHVPAIAQTTPALPVDVRAEADGRTLAGPEGGRFGVWPHVTAGGALVLGGLAVWQGLAARDDNARFTRALNDAGVGDRALADRIDREQGLAWGFGAAGIAAAGAAVLMYVFDDDDRDATDVSVAPAPGGLSATGRF